MENVLQYPFDSNQIMRKARSIKRSLEKKGAFVEKKIAILGGSTTNEIKTVLELFLLDAGIKPIFYESEYNKYYEDSILENKVLKEFEPDFIYIHTTTANIKALPECTDSVSIVEDKLESEYQRLLTVWDSLQKQYNSIIIQNNFELPYGQYLGNLDGADIHGIGSFTERLNQKISEYIQKNSRMQLNDIHYLSAKIGLTRWYDREFWHLYKFSLSYEAIPELAYNIAKIIKAHLGKSKKCLVVDLDNTLWGGVIGDDGLNRIQIGRETPLAEAYTEFQEYLLRLKNRGIILAVCSKNDYENAAEGFTHPDSILKMSDFASFRANWNAKHLNIMEIAKELNIGLDSMVFIDDNPAERQIVRANLPEVVVPEVEGNRVNSYLEAIDGAGFFEPVALLKEDFQRNQAYQGNCRRQALQKESVSHDEFLKSLDMKAEIESFKPIYLERITQLTNKTNQFNLTTRRYTMPEIEIISQNVKYITLYGRLKDRFGDNGLVSVIIAEKKDVELHIDLWLMSCRVLKRGMEQAMFDRLVEHAKKFGVEKLIGYYMKSAKNGMVSDLFKELGFTLVNQSEDDSIWEYSLSANEYRIKNNLISVN